LETYVRSKALNRPAAGYKVNHCNDQSDYQEDMNQPAGHMEAPTQKPQNDEDGKNCPKHRYPLKSKSVRRLRLNVRGSFLGLSCLTKKEFSRRTAANTLAEQPVRGHPKVLSTPGFTCLLAAHWWAY